MDSIAYSTAYRPPAPIIQLRVSAPFEAASEPVTVALIDTGADLTLIPLDMLLKVGAPEMRQALARGVWDEPRPVTLYQVDLHIADHKLVGVEVIGLDTDEPEIILGRDVVNRLILLLDGPQLQLNILNRRPAKL
ncbi:MAG: hypothetical protein NZM11_08150 [Anaerolineales bacterium]|nr:hypothetical protein [Anaerolineales bacterium]